MVHVGPEGSERVCAGPDDDIFTAAAAEGGADYLITGNIKHFPASPWRGIMIVDPSTFLALTHLAAD